MAGSNFNILYKIDFIDGGVNVVYFLYISFSLIMLRLQNEVLNAIVLEYLT